MKLLCINFRAQRPTGFFETFIAPISLHKACTDGRALRVYETGKLGPSLHLLSRPPTTISHQRTDFYFILPVEHLCRTQAGESNLIKAVVLLSNYYRNRSGKITWKVTLFKRSLVSRQLARHLPDTLKIAPSCFVSSFAPGTGLSISAIFAGQA